MNSSVAAANSKELVIQAYQGNGSPEQCSLRRIEEREARIKKKFSEMGYFRKAAPIDKSLIYLKCMKLNYLEIVKVLGAFTFVGGVCGGVIGAAGNAPGAGAGIAIGAGVGGAAGAYWCWHKGLYNKEEHIVAVVKDTTEYSIFKKQRTEEQYELFSAFFKNYAAHMEEKYEAKIMNFICSFTLDIPEYPVFSPYDEKRLHPFEKAEIEKYLDGVEDKISEYRKAREKAIEEYKEGWYAWATGPDDPRIEEGVQKMRVETEEKVLEMRANSVAFPGPHYTKDQLVYDPEWVKEVIKTLKGIQQELKTTLSKNQDPVIIKGVDALVDHYVQNYQTVTQGLIKALAKDVFAIDGDIELAHDASEKISKMLMKV